MCSFTARKLRAVCETIGMTQAEADKYMHMDERTIRRIESNEKSVIKDEIVQFSRIYRVDVRELLLEEYVDQSEEQILFNRYISLYRLFDQLADKDMRIQ